ncbi:sarcosine oxidase subunit gamma [Rhodovulum iodosum]|uniref:Sarcosine oxidase subunit gamma n=1 Tax=Rhodovulum iodosum TaxID=68291 RepID=A0ABV3XN88_9RHOB|nr:sarcosine oxidase subunit gamma family protein [Rhodovulum robiginosum]RSK35910.1 sarcosine oxidase subunit gamma [Rhodovulum robiginosum]
MSEPQTPLGPARFDGIARIEALPARGMITLRGDLGQSPLRGAVHRALGVEPGGPGTIVEAGGGGAVAWMAPDEVLLFLPGAEAAPVLAEMRDVLADAPHLLADVSDARALFRVSGPGARDVLAKLAPVDFAPDVFPTGSFRRTRLAQVPAAIWLGGDGAFGVMCFRSVARYAFDLLGTAAAPGGEVGYY